MEKIYLDYNATTPVHPEVIESMEPYFDLYFGNPSSSHWSGVETRKAIEEARQQVSALLGCQPDEVVFTSGASESNNLAIKGYAFAHKKSGNHIITSQVEHPAVTEVCRYLEHNGFQIDYLPVDEYGMISVRQLEDTITPQTILITIMHANNEVGTIQPIEEISETARKSGIAFHTDAAQSVGKIPVNVNDPGIDLLSVAGHKFYAPKGIGALYVRKGIKLEKLIHGADHEMNLRAGTENVPQIVGLGKACEIAVRDLTRNMDHMKGMRDRLENGLTKRLPAIRVNGHPEKRLPNTSSIAFPDIEAGTLLSELNHIAASAGAACHTDSVDTSPVLKAMNIPDEFARGTIRFSTGRNTTGNQVDSAVDEIVAAYKRINPGSASPGKAAQKESRVRLTRYTHGLGCACKLRPQDLDQILRKMPLPVDPDVIIDHRKSDDAAVYRISPDTAIVSTVDFFTPIVDDPYHFGTITTANALSDIYAMGADPLFALNIVAFPSNRLPMSVLEKILEGANNKAEEAGITILGGHSIEDNEPKLGLAVTGVVHPDRIISNSGARPGDRIILTKPVGTGILSTAMKREIIDRQTELVLIETMEALNQNAARIMKKYHVACCTDVTGFGLLGHLLEISIASKIDMEIRYDQVPVLPKVREFVAANIIPGGTMNNLKYVTETVDWDSNLSDQEKIILADAQTSGGLLICASERNHGKILQELLDSGIPHASLIGMVSGEGTGRIRVIRN